MSKRDRLVDKLISLLVRRGATEKNSEIIHAEIIAASIEMVDLYYQSLQTGGMNQDEYRELQIAIHTNAERHRNAVAELQKQRKARD